VPTEYPFGGADFSGPTVLGDAYLLVSFYIPQMAARLALVGALTLWFLMTFLGLYHRQ
jgi:hypothetical protein